MKSNSKHSREIASLIEERMESLYDEDKAMHLMRFFKTGEGEYGYGDKFLGIKVPVTREIVRQYKSQANLKDVEHLIDSQWHEIRLCGFLLLTEIYHKYKREQNVPFIKQSVELYLKNINKGNNWDLVDLVAPKILGDWVLTYPEERKILYRLAGSDKSLWEQRVAIVSTLELIKHGEYSDTFNLAKLYLDNKYDLINKATGWMLREIGKRGGREDLLGFLKENHEDMPRTMFRYAVEHLKRDGLNLKFL